jgi:hypothetical protein
VVVGAHSVVVSAPPTNHDASNSSNGSMSQPQYQVCDKIDHTTKKCWYRYEDDSTIESCTAGMATSSDNNWYTNSWAIDHITGDLDRLTMHDSYSGHDQIHVANRSAMNIAHIGTSIIPTPTRTLTLNNVLHVPSTHKILFLFIDLLLIMIPLLSFTPISFLLRIKKMRKVLVHEQCKGGLYPLPSSGSKF